MRINFPIDGHALSQEQLIQVATNAAKDLLKRGDFRTYILCDRKFVVFTVISYFEMSLEDDTTYRKHINLLFKTAFLKARLAESDRLLKQLRLHSK